MAVFNLRADKKAVRKIVFGLIVIQVMMTCFVSVLHSYHVYKDDFNKKYKKDCYYYTEAADMTAEAEQVESLLREGQEICRKYSADSTVTICDIMSRDEEVIFSAGNIQIIADGNYHRASCATGIGGAASISDNIKTAASPVDIALYQKGMKLVPDFLDDGVTGRYPEGPGEIMLDNYILEIYGFHQPAEELVGKTVSLYYDKGKNGRTLFHQYKLVGIFSSDMLAARESRVPSDLHLEHIYVNMRDEDRKDYRISYSSTRYYLDDYAEYVGNYDAPGDLVRLNLKQVLYGEGEIQVTAKGMEYCVLYFLMENIGIILLTLGSVIALITLFSILYLFGFFRNRQKKYRMMLTCIGMQKSDQRWVCSLEILLILFESVIGSSYFSAILLMILNYVSTTALGFAIRLL